MEIGCHFVVRLFAKLNDLLPLSDTGKCQQLFFCETSDKMAENIQLDGLFCR